VTVEKSPERAIADNHAVFGEFCLKLLKGEIGPRLDRGKDCGGVCFRFAGGLLRQASGLRRLAPAPAPASD
jgi:hypothetical protein